MSVLVSHTGAVTTTSTQVGDIKVGDFLLHGVPRFDGRRHYERVVSVLEVREYGPRRRILVTGDDGVRSESMPLGNRATVRRVTDIRWSDVIGG